MNPSFNLQRFLDSQKQDYEYALRKIKNGQKQSHWMWYIFPQLKGFGHSYNPKYYGISSLDEIREEFEDKRRMILMVFKKKARQLRDLQETEETLADLDDLLNS